MAESLGMMGAGVLDIRKSRTCGSGGGGSLLVHCEVDSGHCQATGVGILRVQQGSGLLAERGSCRALPAGLTGSLFIFVQVALSTCIIQACS